MKRNNFILIAICFVALAFITGFIYYRGKQRHPFRYELDLTLLEEWYNSIDQSESGSDRIVIDFVDNGPYDFSNDTDQGSDSLAWAKKEDSYFIVYYSKAMDPKIGSFRASLCLQVANEAIGDLERIMGKYYYPWEVLDNRKSCIYLPENEAAYTRIIDELCGRKVNSSNSIGMTISTVTQCGPSIIGIVIHPDTFIPDLYGPDCYRSTLRHEMSHYVFFTALDYGKSIKHPKWVFEGIADYIGEELPQISGIDSIRFIAERCELDAEFPDDYTLEYSSYWAGESFYTFLRDSCGVDAPTTFIKKMYESPVAEGLATLFPEGNPKDKWMESLFQSDSLRHSVPSN